MMLSAFDAQWKGKLFHSAVRSDGREIVTVGHAGTANVWSLPENPGYRVLPLSLDRRVHIHPSIRLSDGKLVTAGIDGQLGLWDRSGELLAVRQVPGDAYSIADAAGRVAVAGTMPESLPPKVYDLEDGTVLELAGHEKMVYNLAAAGDAVVTSSYDGNVRIYKNTQLEQTIHVVDVLRLSSVGISADASLVAVGDENGRLYLIEEGKIVRTIDAHGTWIQDIEFSRDGSRIVTGGRQDHTAKIWDVKSGAHLLTIVAHSDNMARASFSPDGLLLATCALDHSAKIWDASTGDLLRIINGPSYTCEFSADGSELFTTGYHGYAVVWDLRADERSAAAIASYVAERSPFRLADGRLEAK
jgi:WD40 repeat protein